MKSNKKIVKAWVVLEKGKKISQRYSSISYWRENYAMAIFRYKPDPIRDLLNYEKSDKIIPCTITYNIPSKKPLKAKK